MHKFFLFVFLTLAILGHQVSSVLADTLHLEIGQGQRIDIPNSASSLFVSNPAVADIQLASPKILFVFAKEAGETSVLALDEAGETIWESQVKVSIALSDLNELLERQVGDYGIVAKQARSGVVLSGRVPTPELSNKAVKLAEGYLGGKAKLVNFITVSGLQQVNLRVQVAEISRSLTDELGIDWDAAVQVGEFIAEGATNVAASLAGAPGGSITLGFDNSKGDSILSVIRALSGDGLISILAEPNLTAQSGQKAKFLAGGEFPVPVGQGNSAVSVEFRDFGVGLEFLPTVLSEDKIQLEVATEVSELSTQGAITAAGQNVFAVTTRRAETGVTLASGQTFAIAGLIQNTYHSTINRVPGLSEAPVIGPLFRSNSFRKNDTELIIIVTPYIVNPAPRPSAIELPEVTPGRSTHLELLLFGQNGVHEVYGPQARHSLSGNPGFLLE